MARCACKEKLMSKVYKYDAENNPVLDDALIYASTDAPTAAENDAAGYVNGSVWVQTNISGTVALFVKTFETTAGVATWTVVPAASTAVLEADYDAQSVLVAILNNTPVVQTVGAGELVGRALGGNVGVIGANGFTLAFLANILNANSIDCTDADIFAAFAQYSMNAAFVLDKVAAGAIAKSKLAITAKAALADDDSVIAAADFVKGVLTAAVINVAGKTKTTPTAAAMVAALPGAGVGTMFQVVIINKGAGTITLAMDGTVTNLGHAGDLSLTSGSTATYNVLITGAATADFYKIR
jgi:hypothetical protein